MDHAYSSACGECESLESRQSLWASTYGFALKECGVAQTIKSLFTGRH